jgi:hypothetical protein
LNEDKEKPVSKRIEYEKDGTINFRCPIGKVNPSIHVMIEPDPHGDDSGEHSHFHATLLCPKTKIVDFPEPDRCKITNESCPFAAPIGNERTSEQRKFRYSSTIIQMLAFIEFYGSQLVNEILKKKKLKPIGYSLRVAELEKILVISNLIDSETYEALSKVREKRNKLAHNPNEYLKFSEKELYEWSLEATKLSYAIAKLLKSQAIEQAKKS